MTFNLKPLNVGFHAFELNFNINYKIFFSRIPLLRPSFDNEHYENLLRVSISISLK